MRIKRFTEINENVSKHTFRENFSKMERVLDFLKVVSEDDSLANKLVLSLDMFNGVDWEPFKHHRGTLMKVGFVHFLEMYKLNEQTTKGILTYLGLGVEPNPSNERAVFYSL